MGRGSCFIRAAGSLFFLSSTKMFHQSRNADAKESSEGGDVLFWGGIKELCFLKAKSQSSVVGRWVGSFEQCTCLLKARLQEIFKTKPESFHHHHPLTPRQNTLNCILLVHKVGLPGPP